MKATNQASRAQLDTFPDEQMKNNNNLNLEEINDLSAIRQEEGNHIKLKPSTPGSTKSKTKKSLAHLLKAYVNNFSIDLDAEWEKCDKDNNGVLMKDEAKYFLDSICKHAQEDRA